MNKRCRHKYLSRVDRNSSPNAGASMQFGFHRRVKSTAKRTVEFDSSAWLGRKKARENLHRVRHHWRRAFQYPYNIICKYCHLETWMTNSSSSFESNPLQKGYWRERISRPNRLLQTPIQRDSSGEHFFYSLAKLLLPIRREKMVKLISKLGALCIAKGIGRDFCTYDLFWLKDSRWGVLNGRNRFWPFVTRLT